VTALEYAEKCITGVSVVRELGIMALYLLLFLGLAVTVRKWRMQACLSGRVGKAAEGMDGS
jgi:hypothetical protein